MPFGLAVALSGLWMTLIFPHGPNDSELLTLFRLLASGGMAVSLVLGVVYILYRNIAAHRAWMLRGYAIGLGALTQMVLFIVFLPFLPAIGTTPEANALVMGLGWGSNVVIAEWVIGRQWRSPTFANV